LATKWITSERVAAGATVIIAILTLAYSCVSYQQWNAMRESNEINRKAYNAAYRAFVVFNGLSAKLVFDQAWQKDVWAIAPIWLNTGNSPTRDLQIFVNWCPRNQPLPNEFTYLDLANTGGNAYKDLGPHQQTLGLAYSIGPEIFDFVKLHQALFYFYGWATYKDILDEKTIHRTLFCTFVTDFVGDPKDASGAISYSECPHNCQDAECNRYDSPRQIDASVCGLAFIQVSKPTTSLPAAPSLPASPSPPK
jgi:hypothetical protein